MTNDLLIRHHLKRLRLPAMAQGYQKLAREAAEGNQSYDEYLLKLLELETAQRDENMQKRRITQARFPYLRTLDQFDFSAMPSVNKTMVLQLAKGDYLARKENAILIGNMGTGKTHTAIALGLLACRQGKKCASTPPPGSSTTSSRLRSSMRWADAWPNCRSWTCSFWTRWDSCRSLPREQDCSSSSAPTDTSEEASSSPPTSSSRDGERSSATSA